MAKYFIGVDGGGSGSRARLIDATGKILAEAISGNANIIESLTSSVTSVQNLFAACLAIHDGAIAPGDLCACIALAGYLSASGELVEAFKAQVNLPFALITSDAHAACVGAHSSRVGAVIIIGTGSIGFVSETDGFWRVGGRGFPVSDEGGGAWIGLSLMRYIILALDGRCDWSDLLEDGFVTFNRDVTTLVSWCKRARPAEFASYAARVVEFAASGDRMGIQIMEQAGSLIGELIETIQKRTSSPISLVGGLADSITPFIPAAVQSKLRAPDGDALAGAIALARYTEARIRA